MCTCTWRVDEMCCQTQKERYGITKASVDAEANGQRRIFAISIVLWGGWGMGASGTVRKSETLGRMKLVDLVEDFFSASVVCWQ